MLVPEEVQESRKYIEKSCFCVCFDLLTSSVYVRVCLQGKVSVF